MWISRKSLFFPPQLNRYYPQCTDVCFSLSLQCAVRSVILPGENEPGNDLYRAFLLLRLHYQFSVVALSIMKEYKNFFH